IEIPSSTNVWDETTCGSGNRPQINGNLTSAIFCLNTPVTIAGGGGTSSITVNLYDDAINSTGGPYSGDLDITFSIECGSDQAVGFTL
ncbi:MAG: hypothetical protein HQ528_03935, partial [Candidatus Marinimicrobia bacterium]|nr:hypothetical protein [Candidatus Neomarinimicrobiota bacterium]